MRRVWRVTGGSARRAIDRAGLDALFAALERRGFTLVGPTVRDRAIVLEALARATGATRP